jgi:hypothetical protein
VVSITSRPLYPRERPGTHCTGGRVDLEPVWTCAKNLAPTEIGSPDRPAGSQSLYRLGYPAHSAVKASTSIFILCLTEIILSVDYKEKKINVFGKIIAAMCCLSY